METLKKEIYIKCDCGTHLLYVSKEGEEDNGNIITYYDLALFTYGIYTPKINFWNRVKNAFKYLKDGTFFRDQLTLNSDEVIKLRDFLIASTYDLKNK